MFEERPAGPAIRVEPEPSTDERVALEEALARIRARVTTAGRSAWWRVGVRENVVDAVGERSPKPADR